MSRQLDSAPAVLKGLAASPSLHTASSFLQSPSLVIGPLFIAEGDWLEIGHQEVTRLIGHQSPKGDFFAFSICC